MKIRLDADEEARAQLKIVAYLPAADEPILPEVGHPRIRKRGDAGHKAGPGQLPWRIKGVGR